MDERQTVVLLQMTFAINQVIERRPIDDRNELPENEIAVS